MTTNFSAVASQELEDLTIEDESKALPNIRKATKTQVWIAQFQAIFKESLYANWRQPGTLILQYILTLIFSLIVSFVWFQVPYEASSAPIFYRVITLHALFFTALSNLSFFTKFANDRDTCLPCAVKGKQHFPASVVWFGRYTGTMIPKILMTVLSCTLIYPIVGLRTGFRNYALYQSALTIQTLCNGALGWNASALFACPISGQWAAIFIFFFNYTFSGVPYSSERITWILRWLRYLSPSFYTDQILVYQQFNGATYPDSNVTGDDILESKGWQQIPMSVAIPVYFALTAFYNMTGVLLLHWTSRPKIK